MMHGQSPAYPSVASRLGDYANWSSLMLVLMVVGLVAGTTLAGETSVRTSATTISADRPIITHMASGSLAPLQVSFGAPMRFMDPQAAFARFDSNRVSLQRMDAAP